MFPNGQALLIEVQWDFIEFSDYSAGAGKPALIRYKAGGAGGAVVATVTITYDGSGNPLTIVRS